VISRSAPIRYGRRTGLPEDQGAEPPSAWHADLAGLYSIPIGKIGYTSLRRTCRGNLGRHPRPPQRPRLPA
jgi:hypothetical protein